MAVLPRKTRMRGASSRRGHGNAAYSVIAGRMPRSIPRSMPTTLSAMISPWNCPFIIHRPDGGFTVK